MNTLKDYQEFAYAGRRPEGLSKKQIFHFALGLAGECGEVCDEIKKEEFHGKPVNKEHLMEEIGDVMWYIANLCTELNFNLADVLEYNYHKLLKRYPTLYKDYLK